MNPLGDEALAMLPEWWRKGPCVIPFTNDDRSRPAAGAATEGDTR